MKTHQVLNRLSKYPNVRYLKNRLFLWFTINSQSKLKKIQYIVLEITAKKKSLQNLTRFHGGLFELEKPRNFHNSFLKNYYLNLNFFQELQSAILKNETKNLLEKDANQLKTA